MAVTLSNNMRFVANFRYELRDAITGSTDPVKYGSKRLAKMVTDAGDDKTRAQFNSACNQTMVGFVQDLNATGTFDKHPVTCFYAKRGDPITFGSESLAQVEKPIVSLGQRKKRVNTFAEHKPNKAMDARILEINRN